MSAAAGRVTYWRLSHSARDVIRYAQPGLTIAGFVRHYFLDGWWGGDVCGSTDDRCIGYHHDEGEEFGCVEVCIDEAAAKPQSTDDDWCLSVP